MKKFISPRNARIVAGLVVASACAMAPVAAQAADTPLTGQLTAGSLANSAPSIAAFGANVTGLSQTVHSKLGAYTVTDTSGTNAGYSITVADSGMVVNSLANGTGTVLDTGGTSLAVTPTTAVADDNTNANSGPVATTGAVPISTTAATIDNAIAGSGEGQWDFAADAGAAGTGSMAVTIPGTAQAGFYSDTLTYTTAAPVG